MGPVHRQEPHGEAEQVVIGLTPRVESARFQLVESDVLSSRWFQNVDIPYMVVVSVELPRPEGDNYLQLVQFVFGVGGLGFRV